METVSISNTSFSSLHKNSTETQKSFWSGEFHYHKIIETHFCSNHWLVVIVDQPGSAVTTKLEENMDEDNSGEEEVSENTSWVQSFVGHWKNSDYKFSGLYVLDSLRRGHPQGLQNDIIDFLDKKAHSSEVKLLRDKVTCHNAWVSILSLWEVYFLNWSIGPSTKKWEWLWVLYVIFYQSVFGGSRKVQRDYCGKGNNCC